jgi:hypothetical protein
VSEEIATHLFTLVEFIDTLAHVLVCLLVFHARLCNDSAMKHLHHQDQHTKNSGVRVRCNFVLKDVKEPFGEGERAVHNQSYCPNVEQDFCRPRQPRALQTHQQATASSVELGWHIDGRGGGGFECAETAE